MILTAWRLRNVIGLEMCIQFAAILNEKKRETLRWKGEAESAGRKLKDRKQARPHLCVSDTEPFP